jgi:hypothetical protein
VYGCGGPLSAALANLAANNLGNLQAIAAAGGVAAVLGAMRGHPEAAGVQQWGCYGAQGAHGSVLRALYAAR